MKESLENLKKAIKQKKSLKMFIDNDFIDNYHFERNVYQGEWLGYFELEDLFGMINDNSKFTFEVTE